MTEEALQEGAQGCLIKGQIDAPGLFRALRHAIDRKFMEEALFEQKERAQVTLNSIGDAVICTDIEGNITFLNVVAETMTGWPRQEAAGRPVAEVLQIRDATTGQTTPNPMAMAIAHGRTVNLPPNCILVRRDGHEIAIEDSAAPIHDRAGLATGAVIVFRDGSVGRAMALRMAHAAEHDFLTGLPNRMLLNDRVDRAIGLVRPSHHACGDAVSGSGRFQTHQRFARTFDRRQASSIRRKAPGRVRTRLGHGEPAGRRRIRRAAFRDATMGRCGPHGETDAAGGGRRPFHRRARSSPHHQHWHKRLSRRRP